MILNQIHNVQIIHFEIACLISIGIEISLITNS